ncbi:uncharacterized protein LOC123507530 [Portunus trituberculatus]|uniref:uncharacterized protein LOC123507530 n=1 Tax=Portunus trituberculatus TaxID=210409 RepID=UPI001E1D2080|nr:uncharacterized protein LOC123507530 [Portunus trituberculatus]
MGRREGHRDEMEEEGDWWDVMAKMGMPLLYIIGILCGIVGAICQGVITEYWANSEMNSCFLYSKTASSVVVYQFGTSVSVCNWVTYGTVVSIIIAFLAGLVYTVKVRSTKDLTYTSAFSLTGIVIAMLLMLAVTCTMAEGLRLTCSAMGLNSANNKGGSCYTNLDKRMIGQYLPVQTSTMVRAALVTLSCSCVAFFVICCFHLSDFYRRTLRHRYSGVAYDERA